MVKILKCYLVPKKSYGTLSEGAIFFGQPCILIFCCGKLSVCLAMLRLHNFALLNTTAYHLRIFMSRLKKVIF